MRKKTFVKALVAVCTAIIAVNPMSVWASDSLAGESIYEIMVDRFYDGDKNNNATGEAFRNTENNEDDFRYMHGGDWQGVIDKLDYIKGMGYTAIWISPVGDPQLWGLPDSNGKQWPTAYHGYNVNDPNRANRYFGSPDPEKSRKKLKELVDSCHEKGIKVILDVVPNHVGDYLQGVGAVSYRTSTDGLKTGTQLRPASPFDQPEWYHNLGDIDFNREHPHNDWSTAMLESHDLGGLDDINFDNPEAKDAVFQSIKMWIDYTGADGARVDAAKCMSPSLLHELEEYIGVPTFGENFDMDVSFVKNWVGDQGENGMLDFPLFQAVVNDFAHGRNFDNKDDISLKSVFDQDGQYGSHVKDMVTFIDNHDRNRFLTEAGGNRQKLQNALTFIFSCRGVPVVFQGTEQNRGNANERNIDGIADTWNRWDMQTKDYDGNVIADYFNMNTDTYHLIADMNKARSKYKALRAGTQREMWSSPHYYAFSKRVDEGEEQGQEVICAFNNSEYTISNKMPIRAESSLKPGDELVNIFNSNDILYVDKDRTVTIPVSGNSNKIYVAESVKDPVIHDESQEMVPVTFKIKNATTIWGQNVYITGNIEELGMWDPLKAVGPASCPSYPDWELNVNLPVGRTIEFKAIKKDENGEVEWESSENHRYTIGQAGQEIVFDW